MVVFVRLVAVTSSDTAVGKNLPLALSSEYHAVAEKRAGVSRVNSLLGCVT